MKHVTPSVLNAQYPALLDEVARSVGPIVILRRGKPIARLIRELDAGVEYPRHALKGTVKIVGDIIGPRSHEGRRPGRHRSRDEPGRKLRHG